MPIEDFIIDLFCRVDDQLGSLPRLPSEKLHRSELVTLGMLFALKGDSARDFYRWISNNARHLFPDMPSRTRLFRRLARWCDLTKTFLAKPTLLGVVDTYGIELIHPFREGRSERQIGRKGLSNHRWIVGAKLGVHVNQWGRIVAWRTEPANVHDSHFLPLATDFADTTVVFADSGFHRTGGDPPNVRICHKDEWNGRMLVETVFSMTSVIAHTKKMSQRTWHGLIARLAHLAAVFNVLVDWHGLNHNSEGFVPISIAQFSLLRSAFDFLEHAAVSAGAVAALCLHT